MTLDVYPWVYRHEAPEFSTVSNFLITLVGAEGFEPPTLCSQSRCATRLRHAPTGPKIIRKRSPQRQTPLASLGAAPGGLAPGLILEQYAGRGKLLADTIRFGPVLRAARRGARGDARFDLCIGQARTAALGGTGPRRARAGERLREPEPLRRLDAEQTQHPAERPELRRQLRRAALLAGIARRVHFAGEGLQHRQRLGRVEIIIHAVEEARRVHAGLGRHCRQVAQRRVDPS